MFLGDSRFYLPIVTYFKILSLVVFCLSWNVVRINSLTGECGFVVKKIKSAPLTRHIKYTSYKKDLDSRQQLFNVW